VIISFPFQYIGSNQFGKVYRPIAPVEVFNQKVGEYVKRSLVVDTGADMTIFPKKDAQYFGIDLKKEAKKERTFGVGGRETIYIYDELPIKIGEIELVIPVGFLDNDHVPPLLGRQMCLDKLSVTLENRVTTFKKEN
jgi:hypothetical protein